MAGPNDTKTVNAADLEKVTAATARMAQAQAEYNKVLSSSLNLWKQFNDVIRVVKEETPVEETRSLTMELSELSIELDKDGKGLEGFDQVLSKMKKQIGKEYPVAVGAAVGAMSGLHTGFKNLVGISKGVLSFFGSVVKSAFNMGMAILSIPFKLFNMLVDMAQDGGGGNELAQAYEKVRATFGSFRSEAAAATLTLAKTFKGFNETGLSTFRVFGNMAERIEYANEFMKAFGMSVGAFTKEIQESGGRLAAYQKGLGLTAEEYKTVGDYAIATGQKLQDASLEITKYTLQFSGGVIDKRFSRQMQKAIADVKHFGGATMKEIGRAAAYAKGLNIELEKLTGLMDAFNTFDQAADNAAKLAQSFGMNVDAFKMVAAQSPDEQLDALRKSLQATGKSTKDFTRQEWQLLQQTTGLDDATTRLAFSEKNRGKSLAEIQKEADKAKNKQMTQAQAMAKLADAIERMVKSGDMGKGGFFEKFFKGAERGLSMSPKFVELMMTIKRSLMSAYMAGVTFGKWFGTSCTGWIDLMQDLIEVFNTGKIFAFFTSFAGILRDTIRDIEQGKFSFGGMMDRMKSLFFDFFDDKAPAGKRLHATMKKSLKIIGKIVADGIKWAGAQVVKGIKWITDVISGKVKIDRIIGAAASEGNFIVDMLTPIYESIVETAPKLFDALVDLIKVSWAKFKDFVASGTFMAYAMPVVAGMAAVLFGPAVWQGATGALMPAVGKMLMNVVSGGAESILPKLTSWATKFFASKAFAVTGIGAIIAAVVGASLGVSHAMRELRKNIVGEYTEAQKDVAAGTAGLIDAITFGLVPDFILSGMANVFAVMAKGLEEQINDMSTGLGTSIMQAASGWFNVFGGIGDLIIGAFKGDEDRLFSGLGKILTGVLDFISGVFLTGLPQLGAVIVKLGLKMIFGFFSIFPTAIGKLLKLIGLEGLGGVFTDLGEIVRSVGDIIGGVLDVVVAGWTFLVTMIKFSIFTIWELAKEKLEGGSAFVSNFFGGIAKWIKDDILPKLGLLGTVIKGVCAVFSWGWKEVKRFFGETRDLAKDTAVWFKGIVDGIKSATAEMNALMGKKSKIEKGGDWGSPTGGKSQEELEAEAKKSAGRQIAAGQKGTEAAARDAASKPPSSKFSELMTKAASGNFDADMFTTTGSALDQIGKIEETLKKVSAKRLASIRQMFTDLFKPDGEFQQLVKQVEEQKDKIIGIETSIKPVIDSTHAIATGIGNALNAVAAIAKAANEIDRVLSSGDLNKIDVQAKLSRIADRVGVKKQNYTVKNGMVQVTVNLKVEMAASDIETAMLQRSSSIIRNRLNHVKQGFDEASIVEKPIPNTTTSETPWIGGRD